MTKEATCTEPGEQTHTCDCGYSETQVIPATGHDYVNGVCANCGAVQTPDKPTPDTPDKPTPDTPDKADDGDAVKTGDDSAVGLWIALICLSLIGPAVIVYSKKREH